MRVGDYVLFHRDNDSVNAIWSIKFTVTINVISVICSAVLLLWRYSWKSDQFSNSCRSRSFSQCCNEHTTYLYTKPQVLLLPFFFTESLFSCPYTVYVLYYRWLQNNNNTRIAWRIIAVHHHDEREEIFCWRGPAHIPAQHDYCRK